METKKAQSNMNQTQTSTPAQSEWKKREIGALWKRQSKDGAKKYLAGHVKYNEMGVDVVLKVVVFPNVDKKSEKSPDFVVYVSQDPTAAKPQSEIETAVSKPVAKFAAKPAPKQEIVEDDVL